MSDKEKKNEKASEERVMTKYDLKMLKRKEEKAKAEREKRIATGITVLVLLALVCFVLSFPIRSYMTVHNPFVTIGGEELTKVEFDYSYNVVANNYINTYASYLTYLQLDPSKDFSQQAYSGDMTWKDYFEEMTVDSIKRNKALKADAVKAGFSYDPTEDYNRFVENQKAAAEAANMSLKKYVASTYGDYATLDRIKPCVEEALLVAAYYEKLNEDMKPSEEDVNKIYEEKPESYDSVDYYIAQVDAQLAEESTDEDKQKAMEEAKAAAQEQLDSFAKEDNLLENMKKSDMNSIIGAWLFDDARKAEDKTVLEDATNNRYYCVQFVKRYLNQDPTADIRVLIGDSADDAKEMYQAWQNAGATKESFLALCEGEYYEKADYLQALARTEDIYQELLDWVFAKDRKAGDCEVVEIPGVTGFVMYYEGENKPEWYTSIESNVQATAVNAYIQGLTESCTVEDPKHHLKYLEIRAAQQAALEQQESEQDADASSEQ